MAAKKGEPPPMTVKPSGWPPCPFCGGRIGTIGYKVAGHVACFMCRYGPPRKAKA